MKISDIIYREEYILSEVSDEIDFGKITTDFNTVMYNLLKLPFHLEAQYVYVCAGF